MDDSLGIVDARPRASGPSTPLRVTDRMVDHHTDRQLSYLFWHLDMPC